MSTALEIHYPFTGRWLVQNSPANRVPSHGTELFATAHAIDFVPVDEQGRTAPVRLRSLVRTESPESFPGFGAPILAPVAGTVVSAHDSVPDHHAHRGLPSLSYALTQRRRLADGWAGLAGNHVIIRVSERGTFVALCHLQRGSVQVSVGEIVRTGQPVGACGNSGNSTEPHLHLQAQDAPDPAAAAAVPFTLQGSVPRNGQIVHVP